MGPFFLIQGVTQLFSGTSFFREVESGDAKFGQMFATFEETGTIDFGGLGAVIGLLVVGVIGIFFFPIAEAAILFAINHIRKNEEYSVGSVIKEAFSRFWPILGSTILFGLITIALIIIPIFIVGLIAVFGYMVTPLLGFISSILLIVAFVVGVGLLLTRWSFYFGSVVLDRQSPGFSRSWRLTKKRTWITMGLYLVFYLIILSISFVIEMTLGLVLGNSILLTMIVNLVAIVTTMFLSVGCGVMYLDLKTRFEANDLKEMIEDNNAIN
jgi:membrane-anchored glycerophosphoryl diester phosphodiesterase (GDPDase)